MQAWEWEGMQQGSNLNPISKHFKITVLEKMQTGHTAHASLGRDATRTEANIQSDGENNFKITVLGGE